MFNRSTRALLGLLTALALLATACAGSDADDTAAEAPETETETEATETAEADTEDAADESMDEEPMADEAGDTLRIVSLSPTHTEIMFAIGAGDMLVAVDDYSNFPAAALDLPNELSGFEPNVEAIAAYEPDLVLIAGDFSGVGEQLAAIDIDTWDGPAAVTIEDTYAQIEQLGAATGHVAEAAELVLAMQTDIAELLAATPVPETPLSYYHELDSTLYSVDSTTFIGELYSQFGLVNVADSVGEEAFGYPQLNAEFLVEANPDLIFLADTKCCGESAETVAARPGWADIAAVQSGQVFEMDDDIASRWGPRIVEYMAAVAEALEQATVSS